MTDLSAEDRARGLFENMAGTTQTISQDLAIKMLVAFEAAATERAAKVADAWLQLAHNGNDLSGYASENRLVRGIAQAIRSLSTDGGGGEG